MDSLDTRTLTDGCRVALAPGATELVTYHEWNETKVRPRRGQRWNAAAYWIASMHLAHVRLTCQQAWDDEKDRRTTLAYVRRKCAEFLDAIAPGWQTWPSPKPRHLTKSERGDR